MYGQFGWLSIATWYPPVLLCSRDRLGELCDQEASPTLGGPSLPPQPPSWESLEVSLHWKVLHIIVGPDGRGLLFSSFSVFFHLKNDFNSGKCRSLCVQMPLL